MRGANVNFEMVKMMLGFESSMGGKFLWLCQNKIHCALFYFGVLSIRYLIDVFIIIIDINYILVLVLAYMIKI